MMTEATSDRTVKFPADRSLGELYKYDAQGNPSFLGEATGSVKAKAGEKLLLTYNFDPVFGCLPLTKLKPDAVQSISFLGSEITDADLIHLEKLTGLKEIDLSCTHTGNLGVGYLRALSGLQRANLSSTEITNIGVKLLCELKNIRELILDDTYVTDDAMAHISALTSLSLLSLSFTDIGNKALSKIKNTKSLEILRLNSTKISDEGLPFLSKLTNLKELWLRGTSVSRPGKVELHKWLPHCDIII